MMTRLGMLYTCMLYRQVYCSCWMFALVLLECFQSLSSFSNFIVSLGFQLCLSALKLSSSDFAIVFSYSIFLLFAKQRFRYNVSSELNIPRARFFVLFVYGPNGKHIILQFIMLKIFSCVIIRKTLCLQ